MSLPSSGEIERLVVRIMGDTSHFTKGLQDSMKGTEKFVKHADGKLRDLKGRFVKTASEIATAWTNKVGGAMKSVGRSLLLRVTLPLAAFGVGAVFAFSSFDKAMVESTSIMKVTEDQIKSMRDLAMESSFSGEVLQSPKEMAEAYFFLASAGKDAAQSMALIKPVAEFATAGAFNMAQATDLLTDAQSALGMTSKNAAKDMEAMVKLGDTLVKANTLANASVEQFSTALTSKAGSSFKAYNIALEEGVALLAAYADQGIKAELAGNAADRMIRLLTKAVADNSAAFDEHNIKVFDEGEFRPFKAIIGDIERATAGMTTEMKAATLAQLGFEARVQQVILPLLGSSEAIGDYSSELKEAGGVMSEVAQKQMKAFANQMKIMRNQIKVVAIEIGAILAPAVEWVNQKIAAGLKWWRSLGDTWKRVTVVIGILAAALGPALIVLGTIISIIGTAIPIVASFVASVGWIPIVIAALVPVLIAAVVAAQKMFRWFDPLIKVLLEIADVVKHEIMEIWKEWKLLMVELGEGGVYLKQIISGLGKIIVNVLVTPLRLLIPIIKVLSMVVQGLILGFKELAGMNRVTRFFAEVITGIVKIMGLGDDGTEPLGFFDQPQKHDMTQALADAKAAQELQELFEKEEAMGHEGYASDDQLKQLDELNEKFLLLGKTEKEVAMARAQWAGMGVDALKDMGDMYDQIESRQKELDLAEENEKIMEDARESAISFQNKAFALRSGESIKDMEFQNYLKTIKDEGMRNTLEASRSDFMNVQGASNLAKKMKAQSRISPLASVQAAAVGSAEDRARMIAFRSTTSEASAAERTASEVELIREILERIEKGETLDQITESAGL
jgi:TP901 family phage tail tape measure protein